jgi:hypothetical protein
VARCALKNLVFHPIFRGVADREGSIYVYQPGTAVAATVYQNSTGATAMTQPIPFSMNRFTDGFVEAGEYTLGTSSSGLTTTVDATSGDSGAVSPTAVEPTQDPALSVSNMPWYRINSVAATTTSQTLKLVRIVPRQKITVSKVVVVSGSTAVAA